MSHHLWGFLNENLDDAAWEILDNCESQNGLEVWRRITEDFTKKTEAEPLNLEDAVVSPTPVSKPQGVASALEKWDTAYKAYIDAGGEVLTEKKKMGAILRLLPWSIKEKALWSYDEFRTSLDLRQWIRKKLRLLESWRRPGQEINIADDEDDDLMEAIESLGEDASKDEILAMMQSRFPPRQLRGRPPPGAARDATGRQRSRAPPRDARDIRCGNCGGKGHSSRECKQPPVPKHKRKCFSCGQEGHESVRCPQKTSSGSRPAAYGQRGTAAHLAGEDDEMAFCVNDDCGPPPAHRATRNRAVPGKMLDLAQRERGKMEV